MSADLYADLGLSKGASEAEIKKAYRTLARKYHPDVNKDAGAEDKFKDIQKAYGILSDPQKKSQYDQFGIADDTPGGQGGGFGGFGGGGGFGAESFDDIFDTFFGGQRGGRRGGGATQGNDLRFDLEVTLEEAATGIKKEININHLGECSRCEGNGAQPGTKKETCNKCHGSGQVKIIQKTFIGSFSQVSTCPDCRGEGQKIAHPCLVCHGKGVEQKKKKIEVDIPAGVETGVKLRVVGEGDKGTGGGPSGDLYVFISVKRHKHFVRNEDHIRLEVSLPFTQLILGTEIEVPTLTGKAKIKIPEGTQPDTTMRLKGKGLPHLQGYGTGDQFVIIKAELPKRLNKQEKKLVEELSDIRGDSKKSSGIFSFIKRK